MSDAKKDLVPRKGGDLNPIGWMVTYSDVVTLLLLFFIVSISTSNLGPWESRELQAGLMRVFLKEDTAVGFLDISQEIDQSLSEVVEASVYKESQEVEVEFSNLALFRTGSATLRPRAYDILDRIADLILRQEYRDFYLIQVEGHTDDRPISNSQFASNWELSAMRAVSIVKYFEQRGLDKSQLRAIGFADSFPKAETLNTEAEIVPAQRFRNRRVNIKISVL